MKVKTKIKVGKNGSKTTTKTTKYSRHEKRMMNKGIDPKTGKPDQGLLDLRKHISDNRTKLGQTIAKYGQIAGSIGSLAPAAATAARNNHSLNITVDGETKKVSNVSDGTSNVLDWMQ